MGRTDPAPDRIRQRKGGAKGIAKREERQMSSVLTNTSAMVALQTMKSVNAGLSRTQAEISTGKSVNNAKDNATVWMTLAFEE